MVTPAPAASDSQRRRARRTLVVAIGTFLTVTTAGGAVLVAMSSGQAQSLPSASASLPPPSVVPTASATSSPPAIVTGISPDLLPPSIKPTAKQPVVVAPSASAKVSCDPPYSYDSQGLKVFKIECMPK